MVLLSRRVRFRFITVETLRSASVGVVESDELEPELPLRPLKAPPTLSMTALARRPADIPLPQDQLEELEVVEAKVIASSSTTLFAGCRGLTTVPRYSSPSVVRYP